MNIITGENASGKTLYMYNKIHDCISKDITVCSNLIEFRILQNRGYNAKRLEVLSNILDYVDIIPSSEKLTIIADPEDTISDTFCKLLTIVCKEGDSLLLDEPDCELGYAEDYIFLSFLARVCHTFKEVEMITQDDVFLQISDSVEYHVVETDKGLEIVKVGS